MRFCVGLCYLLLRAREDHSLNAHMEVNYKTIMVIVIINDSKYVELGNFNLLLEILRQISVKNSVKNNVIVFFSMSL